MARIIDEYLSLVEKYGGPWVTVRQLQIVRQVYLSGPGGVTAAEIANNLGASHSGVTRTLARWESIGRFGVQLNNDDLRVKRYYVRHSAAVKAFEKWAKGRGFRF